MTKTAFITGISGQDGAYLSQLLLNKNYNVIGSDRRTSGPSLWRLEKLKILDKIKIVDCDLLEFSNLERIIKKYSIDEIYNLAAQSFVASSFNTPIYTSKVNAIGVLNILELIRNNNKKIKFYQASTSEMFGNVKIIPQNELTPFQPRSPYAVSKLFAHWITVNYREAYNIFACSGISFNHESPLRGSEFVTKKIVESLYNIKENKKECIYLGNIDSQRDWGFAGDYVKAMWLMLQHDVPKDYVISTGNTYSVRFFIENAATYFGFNLVWEGSGLDEIGVDKNSNKIIVRISKDYYRPTEVDLLKGDSSKISKDLGWRPDNDIKELIKMMCEYELKGILK